MKKSILFALFCFFTTVLFGQFHVSTNSRLDFSWDKSSDDWKFESEDPESLTFFEFNNDFTLVKHTTSSTTSGYLIKSQEHDEDDGNNQYLFKIVSDVGNKYIMIYDIKNNNIRFIPEDFSTMIKFKIKSTWTDE
ncbi:hypothetical protein [Psychroserpens sp. Hel_I_66]|uniref:hypothetical protein n=1 Tax=Psychroserpens sp. Hel_I_66 TaxID=1250004 RepID=UPI0006479056|nr:hypothetical protein [Psychroserpens sp. Hel_I_66]